MSLPSVFRLSGPKAFSSVFQQAMVSADSGFKVLARSTGQTGSRLGMAVSRKVDRRAVQRNRLKRIVRESFRAHYLTASHSQPVDIVVLPRQQAVSISNEQLFAQLEKHWLRIDRKASLKTPGK
jgi:ribonuclease P protein component